MIRPYPIYDAQSSVLNNIGKEINANKVVVGKGLKGTQTPNGLLIELIDEQQRNNTLFGVNALAYDPMAHYDIGSVVVVDQTQIYIDSYTYPSHSVLSFGSGSNGSTGSVTVGTFVCVNTVPEAWNTASTFIDNVVPAYENAGATVTSDIAQQYRWNGLNYYYPVSPVIPNNASYYITQSGYVIQAGVRYWLPIGSFTTGSTSGPSTGWNSRGIWSAANTYNVNDVVQYGVSTSGGWYICTFQGTTNTPDTGIGWSQVSSFGTWS
jgi:hypothetical protein